MHLQTAEQILESQVGIAQTSWSGARWRSKNLSGIFRPQSIRLQICHFSDRKSTRLNSSHLGISYAVFCLKKKKKKEEAGNSKRGHYENEILPNLTSRINSDRRRDVRASARSGHNAGDRHTHVY